MEQMAAQAASTFSRTLDDLRRLVHIAALRLLRAAHGGLPCRVKFVVEGEEEVEHRARDRCTTWVPC